ncbi:unnamed protein product [Taenia asiatica]|uniref:Iso_dh domain-containing protein n=1 Tax=Taenia asiatica TaxID=60517 RepID=A0A0R3WCQ9_TAEAS|nr:unnamed protein product [Taenia asiatica]
MPFHDWPYADGVYTPTEFPQARHTCPKNVLVRWSHFTISLSLKSSSPRYLLFTPTCMALVGQGLWDICEKHKVAADGSAERVDILNPKLVDLKTRTITTGE